ncbi:hypothetical protein [Mycolicibacterium sp.]|uniref:hypothetical protein n=1 Tax=Mycolicibacterium sp. TaxID=2320850 RepID=UPI003D0D5E48
MTTPEGADGAAWRVELERWHAELSNTIDQASLWAREFNVRTGDRLWGDASAPPSYPLLGYAARLERIGATLKMVCANASLEPPVLSWDRTTLSAPPMIRVPGRDPDWREADYIEGGQYLLYIRPSAPSPDIVTAQHHWRTALRFAAPSVLEREFGIPQLTTYAEQAQGLFDIAHDTIRAAFWDSVAATFGRFWATWPRTSESARPLLMWMTELTQFGCSIEECEAVLRDIEVIDSQAVAICRATMTTWLRDTA